MNILFSPIGGTDPVSEYNFYDGSMLHICRHYDIDKVYMYMSKEIWDKHIVDNRYVLFVEKLAEVKNKKIECEIIADKDKVNVQEYEQFYWDFEKIIKKIMEEKKDEDKFFINVSSGTPAMKSALIVLQDLQEYDCELIQVDTPEKKMNTHTHEKKPDLQSLLEFNAEVERENINRCRKLYCPSISRLRQMNIIQKHIDDYDYRAAYSVAADMEKHLTTNYIKQLELAKYRFSMNMKMVNNLSAETGFDCTPVKGTDARKIFEYALWLSIKLKREEYIDFIRGITPIIEEMFEVILKKKGNLDIEKYCRTTNDVQFWDQNKTKEKLPNHTMSIKEIVNSAYGAKHNKDGRINPDKDFSLTYVKSEALVYLIEAVINDIKLSELVTNLRSVEEKVRNIAAHDIASIDDNYIKDKTGFSTKNVIDMIKSLFTYTDFNIKSEYWNSYEEMNKGLKALM